MASAVSESQVPCCTCASNATAHPGRLVLEAEAQEHQENLKRKPRTKSTKAAHDPFVNETPEQKKARIQETVEYIAGIEANMEAHEAKLQCSKPEPVHPKTQSGRKKGSTATASVSEEVQPDYQDSYNDEDGRKKSYGPNDTMRAQVTLKEAIKNARNRIKASEESDTCAGVSNTQVSKKFALAGEIKNWASDVDYENSTGKSTRKTPTGSLTSIPTLTPSPSTPSESSQPVVHPCPCPVTAKLKTKIGGRQSPAVASNVVVGLGGSDSDGEGLADAAKCEAALQVNTGNLKEMQKLIAIVSSSENEDDLPVQPDPEAPVSGMHHTSGRSAAHPRVKCKVDELEPASDSVSETSFSNSEASVDDANDMAMEVVSLASQAVSKGKHAVRKTTSTSATPVTGCSTQTTVPPAKKLKKELSELSIISAGSFDSIPPSQPPSLATLLCHPPTDSKWVKAFLNTAVLWAGSQDNLWEISEHEMADALQEIFDVVYPNVPYKVTINGSVFAITLQCLSEWRSNIGSTALAIVVDFCSRIKGVPEKDIVQALLEDFAFLYEDTDNWTREMAYKSSFLQQLIASTHLSAIIDHTNIPALGTDELTKGKNTEGLIVLCVIALERALTFIRDDIINVDDVLASLLPKVLNKATRKESSGQYQFSYQNWRDQVEDYKSSIKTRTEDEIKDIIAFAWKAFKKNPANGSSAADGAALTVQHNRTGFQWIHVRAACVFCSIFIGLI
ncbi:hypothetical protein BDR04DRAFT_1139681 [Suillus decipiens]|nr:hypothetical protein BDR04DRAFT_1139681 [Suillus decipiens]